MIESMHFMREAICSCGFEDCSAREAVDVDWSHNPMSPQSPFDTTVVTPGITRMTILTLASKNQQENDRPHARLLSMTSVYLSCLEDWERSIASYWPCAQFVQNKNSLKMSHI